MFIRNGRLDISRNQIEKLLENKNPIIYKSIIFYVNRPVEIKKTNSLIETINFILNSKNKISYAKIKGGGYE